MKKSNENFGRWTPICPIILTLHWDWYIKDPRLQLTYNSKILFLHKNFLFPSVETGYQSWVKIKGASITITNKSQRITECFRDKKFFPVKPKLNVIIIPSQLVHPRLQHFRPQVIIVWPDSFIAFFDGLAYLHAVPLATESQFRLSFQIWNSNLHLPHYSTTFLSPVALHL